MSSDTALVRSLAGVVVTDLVGSTALRCELGDEGAEQLRRIHQRILRGAIHRHRGLELHWLGDGILAAFPSVSAALRAAIAIQQATHRENRRPRRGIELSVRVGVSGGEVTWRAGDARGATIDVATELCQKAAGGQILVSALACELAGSRIQLRTREVRGTGLHVEWQPIEGAAERLGLAPVLESTDPLPFVGRRPELGSLRRALEAVLEGDSRLVRVSGPAGVGKTRLVAELARAALTKGAVVLYGAMPEDLAAPYDPIARVLRFWMENIDDLGVRLGPRSGELVRLVPELDEWVPDLPPPTRADAETERLRLFDAVAEWITTMSLDDPVVLLLDSLHSASNPTVDLLQHVLRGLEESRVLVVVTHRAPDPRLERLQHQTEETFGTGFATQVELAGLGPEAVARLADHAAGGEADPALSNAIHLVTGGNPLHVGELLSQAEPGAEAADLPESVRAALRRKLDRLASGVLRAVQTAAVLGEEFDATLLASLQGDPDATYGALESAVRAGLLREIDRRALRYRFAHAMMREVAYAGIGAARAARLHERAGLLLEERPGAGDAHLTDLARHFAAAQALGHRERAARYAAAAAGRALDQYANEQAAELYATALDLVSEEGRPDLWCDLAIGRGEALRRMGDPEYRPLLIAAAEGASQRADGDRAARALLATYRGTFSRALKVDAEQVERLRTALRLLGDAASPARARLLALLAVELVWSPDRQTSRHISDEAVATARALGDDAVLAEVLAHRQWTVFAPLEDRLATTEELSALVERQSDLLLRFEAYGSAVFTYQRAADRRRYERALDSARRLADEIEQPLVRWMLLIRKFADALMKGRFGDAEALMDEALELGRRTGQPDAQPQHVVQRFWLDVEIQELAAARQSLEGLAAIFRSLPPHVSWPAIAYRCADLGLQAEAQPVFAALVERGIRLPNDQVRLWTLCVLAETGFRLGDASIAEGLLAELAPHRAENANMVFATLGSVARYLGLLELQTGRVDAAERSLGEAERANEMMGAVTWWTRTRLDLAALRLGHRGADDTRGLELLHSVRETADQLGLPTVAEHARRLVDGSLSSA